MALTWDEALFFGALLHLRVAYRTSRPRQIAVKAREIESWLFPNGRMSNPGRDWRKLPEALRRVDQMRIHLPAINADVRVVAIDSIPRTRDGYVSFRLMIPTDAAHGPRIDWQTLVRYRARSGPAYRAYLASQVILDRTARRGRPVTYTARDLASIIAITDPHRAVEAVPPTPRRQHHRTRPRTTRTIPHVPHLRNRHHLTARGRVSAGNGGRNVGLILGCWLSAQVRPA